MGQASRAVCTALFCAALAGLPARAQSLPELRFSGFGTVGAVYSDERNADFINNTVQPNGAGYTRPWSTTPDSKAAAQLDAVFNDRLSAVLQVVSQQRYDNSFRPEVEWANVKWRASDSLSVRLGRIAAPTFLLSDTRLVGFAQPWVRPPVEVYAVHPVTRSDGVDLMHRAQIGAARNTLQAFYGQASVKVQGADARSKPGWGINDTVQLGDWTLRAAFTSNRMEVESPGYDQLIGGYRTLGGMLPAPLDAQAAALADRYDNSGKTVKFTSLGAGYDPGDWFAMGEFVDVQGAATLADARAWYLVGGWRVGSFTPYLGYARVNSDSTVEPGLPIPAAAPLNAGLNQALANSTSGSQSTLTLGVRWDFARNLALKAQYDRVTTRNDSAGRLDNVQPTFVRGSSLNLFSVALDFVF